MKKNLKKDELIHVGIGYSELIRAKRDLLSLQMGLLKLIKTITKYHSLRKEELGRKEELRKKLKDSNMNIKTLQTILPELKIPEIIKKSHRSPEQEESEDEIFKEFDNSSQRNRTVEQQLEDIQNRLDNL